MAYITKEQVKNKRTALRKEFPNVKFSVTNKDGNIDVSILSSHHNFQDLGRYKYKNVNHYYIESQYKGEQRDFLKKVYSIVNEGNYDNSDSQRDYFDVGFYLSINIGKWDKEYNCTRDMSFVAKKSRLKELSFKIKNAK